MLALMAIRKEFDVDKENNHNFPFLYLQKERRNSSKEED
jgi:hypothetical protein